MENTTEKPRQLETAWVVGDGDFTEYVCEEHAREFATERGLTWEYSGSTEENPNGYAYAQFFHDTESDTPQSCTAWLDRVSWDDPGHCGRLLDVALTSDGVDYVRENYPRDWWQLWGIEE
jgi:hypothetical protein